PDSASTARVARSAHHRGVRSAGHQPLSPRRHRHIDQKDRADPANRPLSHHRDQRPAPHPRPRNPQSRPETPPRSRSRWALNSGTSQGLGTLRAIYDALGPLGYLVFETRIPERRAWEEWAEWGSSTYHVEGVGTVRDVFEVVDVQEPYVTIRSDNTLPDGSIVPNESTLIFRSMPELETTLTAAGFTIREVRDAPERPGREWVVIAQRS